MEVRRFVIAFATLVLATTSARADRLTMPEAIQVALAQSPLMGKAVATRAQLVSAVDQVQTSFKPRVTATGSVRFDYVDPLDLTKQEPGFDYNASYNGSLTASKLVSDWGRTSLQVDGARASEKQAAISIAVLQLDIELSVVQSYLGALEATELVTASTNAMTLVAAQLKRSQALYKTSLRPEIDVLSAKTQSAQAKLQLISDQNNVARTLVQLQSAIADPAPRELELVAIAIEPVPQEEQSPTELVKLALAQRAELAGLRAAVAVAETNVRLGRKQTSPFISLQGGLFANGAVSGSAPEGSVSLRPAAGVFAQLGVQWDLYVGGQDTYEVAIAQAQVREARADTTNAEQDIILSVRQAAITVNATREALAITVEWRTDAERQLQVAQTRYDNGVGNFVELNDARVGLVSAQRQEVRARYSLAQARIRLAREVGMRPGNFAR